MPSFFPTRSEMMPKSRNPDTYPPQYHTLFTKVIEHGEHTIHNLTHKEAISLRADLNAYRAALRHTDPSLATPFEPIYITLESSVTRERDSIENDLADLTKSHAVKLTTVDRTAGARAVAASLGDYTPTLPELDDIALPDPTFQAEESEGAMGSAIAGYLKADDDS